MNQQHEKPYEIIVTCRYGDMVMSDLMRANLHQIGHTTPQWSKYIFATDFISTALELITAIIQDCKPVNMHYHFYAERIAK